MSRLFFYFFVVLGVSFLCSLLESFILSVTHAHISIVSKDRPALGKKLSYFKENINRPLSAILSLNTIANTVGAASIGAITLIEFGSSWVAIMSGVLTLSILIFSEIIPKTIGALYWKRILIPATFAVQVLITMTYPLVVLLELLSKWLAKEGNGDKVSREEVIAMAELGEDEGTIEESESTVIENVLMLDDIPVEEVLTPRSVIFALDKTSSVREVLDKYNDIEFSRIPVYEEELDNIIGIVRRHVLLKSKAEDQFDVTMGELAKPIHTVEENDSVGDVLDEFVKRREHLFMVKDQFGQVAGLITLEDAIETLLGIEIVDETDSVVDMRKLALDNWRKKRWKSQEK
ncbi:MAG TPA: HlyC/CorC family transporter [Candidatus Marinimicrobia bacterium]|jgi:CBS domain containing-hemolysin-like protein|nr:HlyC/CorC family transporter [Candidatus Neomarinimicrobiota bacterium]